MRYRLHHVQVCAPPGSEATARRFYVDLLGMKEIPKPTNLALRGGIWLELNGTQLHVGIEERFRPSAKAHPAFEVEDTARLRERLARAGVELSDDEPLPGWRRFYARDPFGNRLEFLAPKEP